MKPKTWSLPKFAGLQRRLNTGAATAAGILEGIWYLTATYDPVGGTVPYDPDDLRDFLGVNIEPVTLVSALVDGRWLDEVDGVLRVHDWDDHKPEYLNKRARQQRYRDKQTDGSGATVAPRWRDSDAPSASASASASVSALCSPSEKEERTSSPAGDAPPGGIGKRNEYTDQFATWWKEYPRSDGKFQASKAYAKAAKLVGHDALLTAVRLFAPYGRTLTDKDGKSTCPHAATWLNQRRFEDDPAIWTVGDSIAVADSELANRLQASWNAWCAEHGELTPCRMLSNERLRSVAKTRATFEHFEQLFGMALSQLPVTNGPAGWQPNFDWMLSVHNLERLAEGTFTKPKHD